MTGDSGPLDIPAGLLDWLIEREGDAARSWLASLPVLVDQLRDRWNLTVAGPPIGGGTFAVVVPVIRDGIRAALKCVWPGTAIDDEMTGLRAWNGHGVVRLLAFDPRANMLLLEWLDPDRPLSDLPALEAAPIAGRLIQTLAIEAPPGVPRMAERVDWAAARMTVKREAPDRPYPEALPDALPDALLSRAVDVGRRYGPHSAPLLVHWDLHHGNILAGARAPWLAIDPMLIAGDPELSIWPMLLRRVDELSNPDALRVFFDWVVEAGGLDPERARAWTLFRAVDYWLWALDHGLTEDPVRCARIIDWLKL